jgi:hypothetical protein
MSYKNENYFHSKYIYFIFCYSFGHRYGCWSFYVQDPCSYKYLFIVRNIFFYLYNTRHPKKEWKKKEFMAFSHFYGSLKYYESFTPYCLSHNSPTKKTYY